MNFQFTNVSSFNEYDIFRFKIEDRYSGLRTLKRRVWSIYQVERLAIEFSMQGAVATTVIHDPLIRQ